MLNRGYTCKSELHANPNILNTLLKLLPTFRALFETPRNLSFCFPTTYSAWDLVLFLLLPEIRPFKVDRLNQFALASPPEAACKPTSLLHHERFPALREIQQQGMLQCLYSSCSRSEAEAANKALSKALQMGATASECGHISLPARAAGSRSIHTSDDLLSESKYHEVQNSSTFLPPNLRSKLTFH